MEIDEKQYEKDAKTFAVSLRQKGYRAPFYLMDARNLQRIDAGSSIEGCLAAMLPAFEIKGYADELLLSTDTDPRSRRYRCALLLDYSAERGFKIRIMTLYDTRQQLHHTMSHLPLQQVPGATMVPTFFPRKTAWDDLLHGKWFKRKF